MHRMQVYFFKKLNAFLYFKFSIVTCIAIAKMIRKIQKKKRDISGANEIDSSKKTY